MKNIEEKSGIKTYEEYVELQAFIAQLMNLGSAGMKFWFVLMFLTFASYKLFVYGFLSNYFFVFFAALSLIFFVFVPDFVRMLFGKCVCKNPDCLLHKWNALTKEEKDYYRVAYDNFPKSKN